MARSKLGIIGGMGAVAGAYMFKRLVELTPATRDQDYIETFVHNNTVVPDRTQGILYGGPSPLPELIRSVEILDRMGADFVVLACMTSHHFIADLRRHARATIIDGIEETVRHTSERLPAVRRVGILASTGNLRMRLFQDRFAAAGIESVVFDDEDQGTFFMEPIYAEWGIKAGHVTGRPRERFLAAAARLVDLGAEAVIGGCSEIPLVLRPGDLAVPLVDAIDVTLAAAIAGCLGLPRPDVLALARPGK